HTLPEIVRSSNRVMDLGDEAIHGDVTAGLGAGTIASQVQGVPGLQGKLTRQIMEAAQKKLQELNLGISLVDLEIKRLNYTKKVLPKVYARMISQQFRIAEKYRALGQGKKAEVAGKLTEETDRIRSEAYEKAQKLKGEGEATAAHIYAKAYQQDPGFYRFWGTLRTYRGTLDNRGVLVLSTDSDLYRYLKKLQ
ncbi:MAG: protease modulator HflC, partial [Acidobacteria bacterium]|nr:protease modulator HflC [Acidobacteriota bacterium]